MGIHLFSYLSNVLDYYSKKVSQLIEKEKQSIPIIEIENLQEEYKNIFINRSQFSQEQINAISNLFSYSESEEKELLKSTKNNPNI